MQIRVGHDDGSAGDCTRDSERRRNAAIMWFLPKQFFSLLVLWKCSLVPEGFDCSHRTRCSLYLSRAHQVLGRLPDTFFEPDTSITEYWDMRLPTEARGTSGGASKISLSFY